MTESKLGLVSNNENSFGAKVGSGNPRKIENGNDGRIDLLTKTITPSTFVRSLRKTLAMVDRGILKPHISIVTFRLTRDASEDDVLKLSEGIAKSLRDTDYFCRISTRGFWAVIHGTSDEIEIACRRIRQGADRKLPNFRIQILKRLDREPRFEWLDRVDKNYFQELE